MYCLPGQEGNFSLNALFSPLFTTSFLHSRIIWKNVIISCLQSLSSPPPQHSLAFIPVILPVHLLSRSAAISEIQWPTLSFHLSHLFRSIWLSWSFSHSWKVVFFFFFFKLGFWILLCWFSFCFTDCPSWVSCVESSLPPPSLKVSMSQDPVLCLASHSVGVFL